MNIQQKRRGIVDKDKHLESLVNLLKETEQDIKDDADKKVELEHCINIKKMCDYKVSCSYGDIVFIICILKDYLKLLEEKEGVMWDYYKENFSKLADKLSAQIEYNYDKELEKCKKKMSKKASDNDIGGEAMALAIKRGKR